MIFPALKGKKFGYVNLNNEAKEWVKSQDISIQEKSLADPDLCQQMVEAVHKKYSLDFSYGGWMEDRSFLWHGSYLDEHDTYIHLGIDLNVPADTEVAINFDAEVVIIDNDFPLIGGWGNRIILKHKEFPMYILYAHLGNEIFCSKGEQILKGRVIGKTGEPNQNGKWFPHLHIQIISEEHFKELTENNLFSELDGYGKESETKENSRKFPDPMQYISLI